MRTGNLTADIKMNISTHQQQNLKSRYPEETKRTIVSNKEHHPVSQQREHCDIKLRVIRIKNNIG